MEYLFGITTLFLFVVYLSQTFRLSYWRQKAINRMEKRDADMAKKNWRCVLFLSALTSAITDPDKTHE